MKRLALEQLKEWKRNSPRKPLIVRGARQVGKTFLIKEFGKTAFKNCHYLNFEQEAGLNSIFDKSLSPRSIIEEIQFSQNKPINPETDLLVFDEIQRCPRALTALKYFCEEMPSSFVIAAGSLLGVMLSEESYPVGKVAYLDMYPMTFDEFLEGIGEKLLVESARLHALPNPLAAMAHERMFELWKAYCVTGGLPEVIALFANEQQNLFTAFQKVRALQLDLIDTYMADIAKHCGKLNALHIERLWRTVPAQLAHTQDGTAKKFVFRDALPGIRGYNRLSSYFYWLEATQLLLRTSIINSAEPPLSQYVKENTFKQYLFDTGLLTALCGIEPAEIMNYTIGRYKGYIAENFAAQELYAAGRRDLYCWEGRTSEVEFVIETPGGIVPLEVKSGRITKARSLGVFEERYNSARSIVFSANNASCSKKRWLIPLYLARRLHHMLIDQPSG